MNQWPDVWPQNKCRSLWPIFHGPVIWPYTLKVSWCMNILFWIMNQYDSTYDLKINVGHCDLYFMVQWFCVTSWRLFDVWTSYFGIMGLYDPTFDLKINVGLCDLYFMVQWFCLISLTIWCMSVIFSDNETVWPKLWPERKYVNMTHISWTSNFA